MLNPPSNRDPGSDDLTPTDGVSADIDDARASDTPTDVTSGWSTPQASAWEPPQPELFSHAGLTAVDPWLPPRRPLHQVLFPGGLGLVVEIIDVMVLALAMFVAVRFVAHNYVVEGGSMLPTFVEQDFVIVNRLAYRSFDLSWVPGMEDEDWRPFGRPEAGDVVVFAYELEPRERDFIKRVIAVAGQTVEIHDGFVFVDGVQLIEPYILEQPAYAPVPLQTVEEGKVFLLGDNRNNSYDSHLFGQVDESTIIGRADFRYWPFDRWGLIDHALGDGTTSTVAEEGEAGAQGKVAATWP